VGERVTLDVDELVERVASRVVEKLGDRLDVARRGHRREQPRVQSDRERLAAMGGERRR
jgi:hypothetical protein